MRLKAMFSTAIFASCSALAFAQDPPGHEGHSMHAHDHAGSSVRVTYEELTKTAAQLEAARRATEKYREVRVAQADGYEAVGPYVQGMGYHFVRINARASMAFDLEHPDILLYEKDPVASGGYALVGVSYLLVADAGADGQPQGAPFPKSLASWHRHSNLCLFPDRSVRADLDDVQCSATGGRFTALTQWMIHAWIWKDSPDGVFSPTNPSVH
jgi:hypothetical protein